MTIDWLLDSDPALRWQVLRDLCGAPDQVVADERASVASTGWGARLLAQRDADGRWAGGACFPADFRGDVGQGQPWTSTLPSLTLLREFGIDPVAPAVRETIELIAADCRWEHAAQPFFDGEVEPCINGRLVTVGVYFGVAAAVGAVVERLLTEQLADGGWNCEAENGSVRSSFASTICELEGLLAYERAGGASAPLVAARRRGERYLLERRLFRGLRSGEVVDPDWLHPSFPTWWHYDVLRALGHFRDVGGPPDSRLDEAVELLRAARRASARRHLGARARPSRTDALPGRRRGRPAEPVDHAARAAGAHLVRAAGRRSPPRSVDRDGLTASVRQAIGARRPPV